jgi:DNA (cytosine-5)-methyltransferase 1
MKTAADFGCGIGGATRGLRQAGFDRVIGIDIEPQPHYCGDEFIQADALELIQDHHWLAAQGIGFNWWSAPCQRWSRMCTCRPELAALYPDLVTPMRPLLKAAGLPYVMENVEGCPLHRPVMLCGRMFGVELYRHRLFEAGNGAFLQQPPHDEARMHDKPASKAGHWVPGTVMSIAGHVAPIDLARALMGIDWYVPRESLVEAVPTYMARWIGERVLEQLQELEAA